MPASSDSHKAMQEALAASQARYQALLDHAMDGIFLCDARGRFTEVNASLAEAPGSTRDKLLGQSALDLVIDRRRRLLRQVLRQVEKPKHSDNGKGADRRTRVECRVRTWRADRKTLSLELSLTRLPNGRIQGIARDISQRLQQERRLSRLAFEDGLTGLANRTAFTMQLADAIEALRQSSGQPFAVLFLDLDRFKLVNDSLGHLFGDRFLRCIAERLNNYCGGHCALGRIGGDEFAVLVNGIESRAQAEEFADGIHRLFKQPISLEGRNLTTSFSVGILLSQPEYDSAEAYLRDVDVAMYQAKERGRGCSALFNRSMRERSRARLAVENDLRGAIASGELKPHYQPIVAADGLVTGFEVLARWHHPKRGVLAPAKFIDVAEETGLILDLDLSIIRQACAQLATWQKELGARIDLSISVNLSAACLTQTDLVSLLTHLLTSHQLAPQALHVEITETVLLSDFDRIARLLNALRAVGVRVALDDFGVGYSSLHYLHRFPIDALKIDRSFVNRLPDNDRDGTIVESIIDLGSRLELDLIAEGVETEAQWQWLCERDVGSAQGALFAMPLGREDADQFLRDSLD